MQRACYKAYLCAEPFENIGLTEFIAKFKSESIIFIFIRRNLFEISILYNYLEVWSDNNVKTFMSDFYSVLYVVKDKKFMLIRTSDLAKSANISYQYQSAGLTKMGIHYDDIHYEVEAIESRVLKGKRWKKRYYQVKWKYFDGV